MRQHQQQAAATLAGTPRTEGAPPVLSVQNLRTWFYTRDGIAKAVDGVSFDVRSGETLCVVGESGCGKSVTAMSILRLLPMPPARIVEGRIEFEGRNLLEISPEEMQDIRGNVVSMIFQEPMTSLNPVLTVGRQIAESFELHQGMDKSAALEKAVEMLDLVRIPDPRRRVHEYPHQMSGGMRQRVMIAMALSCRPRLLIADEPTTALDVTIQAQILELMDDLKRQLGSAIMLITHDLGVVAEMAERVIVMYAGRKVEEAPVGPLFARPLHPYTHGLMRAIPRLDRAAAALGRERLQEIPGTVPSLKDEIVGCAFAPRCAFVAERCRREAPPLELKQDGHLVACFEADRVGALAHA